MTDNSEMLEFEARRKATAENTKKRVQRARRNLRRRVFISNALDSFLTAVAGYLHMCGEGAKNNWSLLFAQMWFTDCPCCLFYRGATFGFFLAALLVAIGAGAYLLI